MCAHVTVLAHVTVYLCIQVQQRLFAEGFMTDMDVSTGDTFNKKIRNAQLAQYNYILGMLTCATCHTHV